MIDQYHQHDTSVSIVNKPGYYFLTKDINKTNPYQTWETIHQLPNRDVIGRPHTIVPLRTARSSPPSSGQGWVSQGRRPSRCNIKGKMMANHWLIGG